VHRLAAWQAIGTVCRVGLQISGVEQRCMRDGGKDEYPDAQNRGVAFADRHVV
jgi:hypothetical protein